MFFVTDNAHLLAISRANGELLWETPMLMSRYLTEGRWRHWLWMAT